MPSSLPASVPGKLDNRELNAEDKLSTQAISAKPGTLLRRNKLASAEVVTTVI